MCNYFLHKKTEIKNRNQNNLFNQRFSNDSLSWSSPYCSSCLHNSTWTSLGELPDPAKSHLFETYVRTWNGILPVEVVSTLSELRARKAFIKRSNPISFGSYASILSGPLKLSHCQCNAWRLKIGLGYTSVISRLQPFCATRKNPPQM